MTVSDPGGGRGRGGAPGSGEPAGSGTSGEQAANGGAKPGDGSTAAAGASTKPASAKPAGPSNTPAEASATAANASATPDEGTEPDATAKSADAEPDAGAKPDTSAKLDADRTAARESGELSTDERAELEHLREEVAVRHNTDDHPVAPTRRRGGRWRAPVAVVLIVIGCILAPLSVISVWTANQVSNTDRYVANIEPLIHDPSVQRALTDKITIEIESRLNVKGLATQAATALNQRGLTRVGALLNSFSGQLAGAVNGFIHTQVAKIVASPQVARLWLEVNRRSHAQLVKALSGQGGGAITISNGKVVLNLGPFIELIKTRLAARGLTVVKNIPQINPTFPLFSAKYLVKAQTGYRLLNDLKIVLPILTLVLIGLGVFVARSHRRALIGAGLGFAASMLILGLGLTIFRGIYLNSVPSSVLPADAAAVLYDTLVRFIRDGLRVLLVVGLIVAIGAFFTGPSVTAVRTRGAFQHGFDWMRRSGEHAGVSTGPVGRWTYTHRRALRITAVAIAALVFVFWGQPTWVTALVIAIILLIVLALIELIGRPPAQPEVAAQPSS
jgi:hypothetical protein